MHAGSAIAEGNGGNGNILKHNNYVECTIEIVISIEDKKMLTKTLQPMDGIFEERSRLPDMFQSTE